MRVFDNPNIKKELFQDLWSHFSSNGLEDILSNRMLIVSF